MGIVFDTSTTKGKLQVVALFLLSPFLILWSFLKWIGERLGIYTPPVYGDITPPQENPPQPEKDLTE